MSCSPVDGNQTAQSTNSDAAIESADLEFTTINGVKTKNLDGFCCVIDEIYSDSQELWAEDVLPAADSPNVLIFFFDDVRFAQVSPFDRDPIVFL